MVTCKDRDFYEEYIFGIIEKINDRFFDCHLAEMNDHKALTLYYTDAYGRDTAYTVLFKENSDKYAEVSDLMDSISEFVNSRNYEA